MSTLEQRVAAVEAKQRELEAEIRRVKSDIKADVESQNKAAILVIEQMIERDLGSLRSDIEEIKVDNKTQLALLTEAAEERGRRKQREEEIRLRGAITKVDAEDAGVEAMRATTKVTRWKGAAVAFAIIAAAIGGLIGAAIGSHH